MIEKENFQRKGQNAYFTVILIEDNSDTRICHKWTIHMPVCGPAVMNGCYYRDRIISPRTIKLNVFVGFVAERAEGVKQSNDQEMFLLVPPTPLVIWKSISAILG